MQRYNAAASVASFSNFWTESPMKSASLAALAVLLISCLALTNTATASNTVDFSNAGATLSGNNAGLSLSGFTLIAITGVVTGMLGSTSVSAVTVQLTANTGMGFFSGSTLISGGDTTIASVPEPSTLGLFVTGGLGILGMVRRKLLSR